MDAGTWRIRVSWALKGLLALAGTVGAIYCVVQAVHWAHADVDLAPVGVMGELMMAAACALAVLPLAVSLYRLRN